MSAEGATHDDDLVGRLRARSGQGRAPYSPCPATRRRRQSTPRPAGDHALIDADRLGRYRDTIGPDRGTLEVGAWTSSGSTPSCWAPAPRRRDRPGRLGRRRPVHRSARAAPWLSCCTQPLAPPPIRLHDVNPGRYVPPAACRRCSTSPRAHRAGHRHRPPRSGSAARGDRDAGPYPPARLNGGGTGGTTGVEMSAGPVLQAGCRVRRRGGHGRLGRAVRMVVGDEPPAGIAVVAGARHPVGWPPTCGPEHPPGPVRGTTRSTGDRVVPRPGGHRRGRRDGAGTAVTRRPPHGPTPSRRARRRNTTVGTARWPARSPCGSTTPTCRWRARRPWCRRPCCACVRPVRPLVSHGPVGALVPGASCNKWDVHDRRSSTPTRHAGRAGRRATVACARGWSSVGSSNGSRSAGDERVVACDPPRLVDPAASGWYGGDPPT